MRRRVGLLGASGRMGGEVIAALVDHPQLELGVALSRADLESSARFNQLASTCELLIDFTNVDAQPVISARLLSLDTAIPLVTGVTGLGELSESWLTDYARRAPTFWAANFSVGVALLRRLSVLAASSLGAGFDAELYELHHRYKLDAPSGTARVLAEAVCEGKRSAGEVDAYVSLTPTTPRDASAVQVSAGRGGGVFGDHTVLFLGESEQIELKHRALNRQVFASGALRAGTWLLSLSQAQEVSEPPKERAVGRVYGMDDLWSV